MSLRWPPALALVAALVLLPVVHAAPPPPAAQADIDYLLGFVANSGCEFYRNGSWHDSKAAQEHLRYKFEWLAKHGQVNTVEDFIEKAATQSSLSGQPYLIRCGSAPVVTTNEWLRIVLARYRSSVAH